VTTYLCVYAGATLLATMMTPPVIWLARRVNAMDHPGLRRVHSRPIPRIGGVAIFLSTASLIMAVLFVDNNIGDSFRQVWLQLAMLLGTGTFIFLVGLADDLKGLPARFKFLAELTAAILLCAAGVTIDSVGVTNRYVLHLGGFGTLLTLLWLVGITNAVNLSDGLDGLAAGISMVACGVIAIFSIHAGQHILAVFMLALAGSLTGFLVFNFNPARIFMGDGGSLFVGFLIAATSVMCVSKSATIVGLALPILALGIPIFDTLFSMLRRFLERRSLWAPDQSHFHHRLLALGLHQREVVAIIYMATLVCAALGIFMLVRDDFGALAIFGCLLLLILILFRVVGAVQVRETLVQLQEKHTITQVQRQERHTFECLQLELREVRDPQQYWNLICKAACQMDFVWVSRSTAYDDGRSDTEIWRSPDIRGDISRAVIVKIPFKNKGNGSHSEMEVAIGANGSLESAARRATLFGRLLDELETRADDSLAAGARVKGRNCAARQGCG